MPRAEITLKDDSSLCTLQTRGESVRLLRETDFVDSQEKKVLLFNLQTKDALFEEFVPLC